MSDKDHVVIVAACPSCGHPTAWMGHVATVGGGTSYRIACDCPNTGPLFTAPTMPPLIGAG